MLYNDTVMQVRELLERHLDLIEIAHRLHLDINYVADIIAFLST